MLNDSRRCLGININLSDQENMEKQMQSKNKV